MRKTGTTVRCVPRFGYDDTEIRTVDLDVPVTDDERSLSLILERWFAQRGIPGAVYGIDVDDNGFFAIINDEAYSEEWGKPIL